MNTDSPEIIVHAPGRINLIGEHIDYNGGYVLPAAIDLKIKFRFRKKQNSICTVTSESRGSFEFNLNEELQTKENHWGNYVLGVVAGIRDLHPGKLQGFDCEFKSELPIGSGISSSAALECGIAKGLNELFGLGLSNYEMIEIARVAEHNFVGTKCGVMDQFAVMMGEEKKLILLNCETLAYDIIDADFSPYQIVLLNTNVSHNLSTSAYNTRRSECELALKIISKDYSEYKQLANIPLSIIEKYKEKLSVDVLNRASYVSMENSRTKEAAEVIQKGQIKRFGELMYQSHEGLTNKYNVSCDELDFLVDYSKDFDQVIGARMMGGGFGGCTINLIHQDGLKDFISYISEAYQNRFHIKITPITVATSDGVTIEN
tara:strand:+ start:1583 stop:2704 length:1122 start_codon:yes stop_codon:yes gene_type:complete